MTLCRAHWEGCVGNSRALPTSHGWGRPTNGTTSLHALQGRSPPRKAGMFAWTPRPLLWHVHRTSSRLAPAAAAEGPQARTQDPSGVWMRLPLPQGAAPWPNWRKRQASIRITDPPGACEAPLSLVGAGCNQRGSGGPGLIQRDGFYHHPGFGGPNLTGPRPSLWKDHVRFGLLPQLLTPEVWGGGRRRYSGDRGDGGARGEEGVAARPRSRPAVDLVDLGEEGAVDGRVARGPAPPPRAQAPATTRWPGCRQGWLPGKGQARARAAWLPGRERVAFGWLLPEITE